MIRYTRIFGADPSLTNCAVVSLLFGSNGKIKIEGRLLIQTNKDEHIGLRLCKIKSGLHDFVQSIEMARTKCDTYAAVETPPQGAKMYSSVDTARATAACEMVLHKYDSASYTAASAKRFVVPDWHGWSKANWIQQGYTKKYKRSQPSKSSVASQLAKRFGVNIANQDMSDAASLAMLHASTLNLI